MGSTPFLQRPRYLAIACQRIRAHPPAAANDSHSAIFISFLVLALQLCLPSLPTMFVCRLKRASSPFVSVCCGCSDVEPMRWSFLSCQASLREKEGEVDLLNADIMDLQEQVSSHVIWFLFGTRSEEQFFLSPFSCPGLKNNPFGARWY